MQFWKEAWTHITGIHERDRSLIEQCCEGADIERAAYLDWNNSRKRNAAGKLVGPADPKLARVLAEARKGWRQDMALLGMTAKDRAAMAKKAEVDDPLDALKRKVVQLRRPG